MGAARRYSSKQAGLMGLCDTRTMKLGVLRSLICLKASAWEIRPGAMSVVAGCGEL